MKSRKQTFEVEEHETVSDCLERMRQAGYKPVRRKEEPVFVKKKGEKDPVWLRQRVVFEGVREE
ncbi:NETI motif-containing protein [Bacillus sp. FSL W7-1360]